MNSYGLDDLVRSLAQGGDPVRQLASIIDDLSVTFELWMPEQSTPELTPPAGRFHNLDWEQR